MKIARPVWQQDLRETKEPWFQHGWLWRRIFRSAALILLPCLVSCLFPYLTLNVRGDQSFAVALPELEGPVTLGIFSEEGILVRLLYREAPVESIPAGLNGLIMTWDEKDEQGHPVTAGNYWAKGLVHGPLSVSCLPFSELHNGPMPPPWPVVFASMPVFENSLSVRAAGDALMEKSPLLAVSASLDGNACILAVEGLPILSIPLPSKINKHSPQSIRLAHYLNEGRAFLMIEQPKETSTYVIAGLDHLVPLSAGKLEVSSDAFHSSPSAGESVP